jgi:hypothetical protein
LPNWPIPCPTNRRTGKTGGSPLHYLAGAVNKNAPFFVRFAQGIMTASNLIPRIGERIEQLDTAIFSGSASLWRYPACIVRHLKVDRSCDHLWFRMKNISLGDEPGQKAPAFLFCYNKLFNYYITVEGDAVIAGLAGDLRAPEGWQDPLFANQTTYLIRMKIRHAASFYRSDDPLPLSNGKTGLFPDRTSIPPAFMKKSATFDWSSFLTGLF